MRNPFQRDLILLHAPALYDFRARPTCLGPVADAVLSTAIFEMYPVGLWTLATGLALEIVRTAARLAALRRRDHPRPTLIRASTMRQPRPAGSTRTGLRSSSTISGTSSASLETRSSTSRSASMSAAGWPR